MTQVLSLHLEEGQLDRLREFARELGRTTDETGALLVEESLRRHEFPGIDFRPSPVGRQAYVQGSTLAVWEVMMVARCYALGAERTAEHLGWPRSRAVVALEYAAAYPDEIQAALQEHDDYDFETVRRQLPNAELASVRGAASEGFTRGTG
jgi:hypothetical protein